MYISPNKPPIGHLSFLKIRISRQHQGAQPGRAIEQIGRICPVSFRSRQTTVYIYIYLFGVWSVSSVYDINQLYIVLLSCHSYHL